MKIIIYLLVYFPFISLASGNFLDEGDTIIWSGNVALHSDQLFTQDQTLKVLPGTIVTASGPYKIEIRGHVIAEGTAENPILFTATDTLDLYDSATIAGGWHGIHLLDNDEGTARFEHCRFEYGKANIPGSWTGNEGWFDRLEGNQGGAFRITGFQSTEFNHCIFFYNYARSSGGGIYCHDIQNISFSGCDFSQNKAMVNGGAIFSGSHLGLTIDHCVFKKNIAWAMGVNCDGSAVYLDSYPPNAPNVISNNSFFNNYSGTTFSNFTSGSLMVNNIFTNNFNWAVLSFNRVESTHVVYNNIIANNYFGYGIPGVYTASYNLRFYNNILWDNLSDSISHDDMAIIGMPPDVQYCLVWEGRIDGENIITDDPLFVNPAPGLGLESNGWEYDWSLRNESPAINAGIPDTTGLNLPAFDIEGNPRIYGGWVDMGAYEKQYYITKINDSPVYNTIKLYPNPSTDRMVIEILPGMEGAEIEMVDGRGSVCMHELILGSPAIFYPKKLSAGIYFYRIVKQGKTLQSRRWVKS